MSDKKTTDPTWAVVPEPDRPGDVPCLCRGDGGVELHWREDSQLWHLRVGGMVYGVSRRARVVIAEALWLVPAEHTVPEGFEWPMVDGEPVTPGDVLWDCDGTRHRVTDVRFWREGCYVVMDDKSEWGEGIMGRYFTRTEPPKPVLDRDGVPIKVGDTVYSSVEGDELYGDEPLEVVRVNTDPDDYKPVEVRTKERYSFRYSSHHLTHERPDSWARLEEDAAEGPYGYWGCEGGECCDCPALVDGETPRKRFNTQYCSEAMACDLVRRAKALAGVVGDE